MLRAKRPSLGPWVCPALLVALLALLLPPATAADAPMAPLPGTPAPVPAGRRSVGLALRGGGALGLAHIGVLQWLDEHRIPVDYVAGTSMGGVIGAMYALDTPPQAIRRFATSVDWEQAFQPTPPYEALSFRRKEEERAYPGGLEFGFRHGVRFPLALDPIHRVGLILSRISFPYSGVRDFNQLPIPFRCVATDMGTGEAVVLGSGSLPRALRATIAIPTLFTPVEADGRILADGGVVDNLPTDVARAMGAQIVIAVDFRYRLRDPHTIRSLFGFLEQAVAIMPEQNVRRNLALADIVVTPNLDGITVASYDQADALAALGYRAAEAKAAELLPLALPPAEWEAYRAARRARERDATYVPAFIEVAGTSPAQASAVRHALARHLGRPLALNRLEADLTDIVGWGRFTNATYEQASGPAGHGLRVTVHEKPYGPPFARSMLRMESAGAGETRFEVPSRLTLFDVGGFGSEWATDVVLGSRSLLASEYYRPLGNGWFVAPRGFYSRTTRPLFESQVRVADYGERRTGAALDLGRTFGRSAEARLGYEFGNLNAAVRTGSPSILSLKGPADALALRWQLDRLNSASVPTRGVRAGAEARWFTRYPGTAGFPQASFELSAFHPLGVRRTAFVRAAAGTSFGKSIPAPQQFTLGGPFRMLAYERGELRGGNLTYLSAGYLRRMASIAPPLGTQVYLASWVEVGGAFDRWGAARLFPSASAGIVADTPLGPLLLTGSLGEGGRSKVNLSVGYPF